MGRPRREQALAVQGRDAPFPEPGLTWESGSQGSYPPARPQQLTDSRRLSEPLWLPFRSSVTWGLDVKSLYM